MTKCASAHTADSRLVVVVVVAPANVHARVLADVAVYANTLLAALNSRRSLNDRAAINVAGTDIFGTEVRRADRDSGTHARAPVSIALRANTGTQSSGTDSYGYGIGMDSGFAQAVGKAADSEVGVKGIERPEEYHIY
uniref:Cell division control protein n=1 Tax=Ganoderma boninense TaxID=34458 RepID=A0A5K1K2B3_9APHY|nr:Cell division control protein [Ganoderma boninense]